MRDESYPSAGASSPSSAGPRPPVALLHEQRSHTRSECRRKPARRNTLAFIGGSVSYWSTDPHLGRDHCPDSGARWATPRTARTARVLPCSSRPSFGRRLSPPRTLRQTRTPRLPFSPYSTPFTRTRTGPNSTAQVRVHESRHSCRATAPGSDALYFETQPRVTMLPHLAASIIEAHFALYVPSKSSHDGLNRFTRSRHRRGEVARRHC